jgi:methionine-rich copper-binding protein CopC
VTNAAGNRVQDDKITVDPHNAQELRVALEPLPPGVYEVHWHTLSADKQLHADSD